MESPIEVVRRFCAAWSDGMGADDLAAFFTDDAVYHNIPLAPVTGREAIANHFATFIRPGPPGIEAIEFRQAHGNLSAPCFPATSQLLPCRNPSVTLKTWRPRSRSSV